MNQTVIPPNLENVLKEYQDSTLALINCVQIGQIEKVNDNQTCEIAIQVKRRIPNGSTINYPVLVDCPYFVLSGGNSYIDIPIKAGDFCLILFNDRNIDIWWNSANVTEPADTRKHSLSDGIALVGISPSTSARDMDGEHVRILGKSGPGSEKPAARTDDPISSVSSEDAIFWTWVTTVSAAINALAPGSVPTVPTSLSGKISGGSSEVKIG